MILTHVTLATMDGPGLGLVRGAAVVTEGERIVWAGPMADLPVAGEMLDLGGRLVTPALIDCHTHLIHAGSRSAEFAARIEGATYAEIAAAGGGILSTVRATRAADEAALLDHATPFARQMLAGGAATVEVKSGYGLTLGDELKVLRAARRLASRHPLRIVTSHLAAHAVPPEYAGRSDAYLDDVVIPSLRAAQEEGLVDAVDAFCEGIAFSSAQVDRLFTEARRLGLPVKLHADQLSNLGGGALAARHKALSADHLEYLDEAGAAAMAAAGTVAVILPGAFYALRETQVPPVAALRRHGVAMAVATDFNPGSSPMTSLTLAMHMACTLFRLTAAEALRGTTVTAARALGLADRGRIAPGCLADLAVWDTDEPADLVGRIGATQPLFRIFGGRRDA
ncbi:MAG TPA: imidazolonepropionase [Paracoccaceae bacterium]|nr:imidazolonepropionase [Paracoccaceae bacterium]HMO71724.1 imidazolonepropionase [Paracoccaceae bacterium]